MAWNIPDIGVTRRSAGTPGIGPLITGVVQCSTRPSSPDSMPPAARRSRLDAFRLLNEIVANPAAYGFANASSPRLRGDAVAAVHAGRTS